MKTNKKICVLIDMDNTLVEKDTDEVQFTLFPKIEYEKFLKEKFITWTERMNTFYKRIIKYGKTLDDIKEILNNMIFTPKIKNFLNYLHSNPDKYDLYILSGATSLSVNCILNSKHIKDYFIHVITNNLVIDGDNFLYSENGIDKNCDFCFPSGCKYRVFKNYFSDDKIEQYSNVVFVCDGHNDFCVAKNFSENNYLFIRKNFTLDKMLNSEKYKNKVKCKNIFKWENGDELIEYFKKENL
jgi:2,3-diketo-5-methylthio-1-phosphopentane phosphatase